MAVVSLGAIAGTAQAAGEHEPNDSIVQTAGPLQGGVNYTAGQETSNDVDWYRFYVRGQVQLRITGTVLTDGDECDVDLHDRDGQYLEDMYIWDGEFNHLDRTLHQPGRYFIVIDCDYTGSRYRFSLSPASAIVASDACGIPLTDRIASEQRLAKASQRVSKLKGRKAAVRGKKRKQKIKAKLRGARSAMKTARADLESIETAIESNC